MIFEDYLREKLYALINKFYFLPFPIIDNLPDDICEYLRLNKSEFMKSLKTNKFKRLLEGFKEDYNKWLLNSNYYFYDLCRWHLKEKFSYVLKSLSQPKKIRILDFGSGIGTRALVYSKKNMVTLVDINKKLLDFSKWRFNKYNRKAEFYNSLPTNKEFELIILIDVIGHLDEPLNVISQLCSTLKKNGILEVTFDNFNDMSKNKLHRNKEVNFHKLFLKNGLIKIDKLHYKKL